MGEVPLDGAAGLLQSGHRASLERRAANTGEQSKGKHAAEQYEGDGANHCRVSPLVFSWYARCVYAWLWGKYTTG